MGMWFDNRDPYGRPRSGANLLDLGHLVASPVPQKRWHEWFPAPTVADAVTDRVGHHAYQVGIQGESLRTSCQSPPHSLPQIPRRPRNWQEFRESVVKFIGIRGMLGLFGVVDTL